LRMKPNISGLGSVPVGLMAIVQSSSISHLLRCESTPVIRQELTVALVEDNKYRKERGCGQSNVRRFVENVLTLG
jgi:hypothetical protein